MNSTEGAMLRPVADDDRRLRGDAIKSRLADIGISQRAFADKADIDRKTLSNAIEGDPTVRLQNLDRIEAALLDLEQEMGMDDDPAKAPGVVEFKVTGNFGVDVVVAGPVENLMELEEAVARLIQTMDKRPGAS
jgi:transcriptional regulator with XRE-family HTH domain